MLAGSAVAHFPRQRDSRDNEGGSSHPANPDLVTQCWSSGGCGPREVATRTRENVKAPWGREHGRISIGASCRRLLQRQILDQSSMQSFVHESATVILEMLQGTAQLSCGCPFISLPQPPRCAISTALTWSSTFSTHSVLLRWPAEQS